MQFFLFNSILLGHKTREKRFYCLLDSETRRKFPNTNESANIHSLLFESYEITEITTDINVD